MNDEPPDGREHLDPAGAFSLLGQPVRLEIVMALHDAESGALSFSELFDEVGIDDTGQFNYHRNRLVPHFVRKTDDGYELTAAAERVARAIAAGTYTESVELAPFAVTGECYDCGAADLQGEYAGERFRIDCRNCGRRVLDVGVPPSLARNRSPEAFVDAFEQWSYDQVEQALDGLCPSCGGTVEPRVSEPDRDSVDVDRFAVFDCTVCGRDVVTSFGALALRHPEVESFFEARESPLLERPYWAVSEIVADANVDVVSERPVRVRVSLRSEGDICRVVVDGDLEVVDAAISAGDGADE